MLWKGKVKSCYARLNAAKPNNAAVQLGDL